MPSEEKSHDLFGVCPRLFNMKTNLILFVRLELLKPVSTKPQERFRLSLATRVLIQSHIAHKTLVNDTFRFPLRPPYSRRIFLFLVRMPNLSSDSPSTIWTPFYILLLSECKQENKANTVASNFW